jgi:hypothetical protein
MFQNLKLQFNVLKSFKFNFQIFKFEMCYIGKCGEEST